MIEAKQRLDGLEREGAERLHVPVASLMRGARGCEQGIGIGEVGEQAEQWLSHPHLRDSDAALP